jgi:hypothetical protein
VLVRFPDGRIRGAEFPHGLSGRHRLMSEHEVARMMR